MNPRRFGVALSWQPKCLTNHMSTVSDVLPPAYYVRPFDFIGLDESVHEFFWEMNAQVADTNEAHPCVIS